VFRNKLNRDDKLLLAFDARVLSEVLRREVGLGKIVHGEIKRGRKPGPRPQATPDTALRIFVTLVRDQEVEASNPFAPTKLLESATYKAEKSKERLV